MGTTAFELPSDKAPIRKFTCVLTGNQTRAIKQGQIKQTKLFARPILIHNIVCPTILLFRKGFEPWNYSLHKQNKTNRQRFFRNLIKCLYCYIKNTMLYYILILFLAASIHLLEKYSSNTFFILLLGNKIHIK